MCTHKKDIYEQSIFNFVKHKISKYTILRKIVENADNYIKDNLLKTVLYMHAFIIY